MKNIADIVEAFGGPTALASALNRPMTTVASWAVRGSIPVEYWPELVDLAKTADIDLTYVKLVAVHADRVA
jgi:hypothetical protein